MNELSALEKGWAKILQMVAAEKKVSKDTVRRVHATITAKGHELAELDAEVSKLINMTEHNLNAPVCVRGGHMGAAVSL